MNFRKIGIVIAHEYSIRVRKKSFILTTILTPLLMGLLICIPSLIMVFGGDGNQKKVEIVDRTGVIASCFESNEDIAYTVADESVTLESVKENFFDTDLYAVIGISDFDEKGEVEVTAYSREPLNIEIKSDIKNTINKFIEARKLTSYAIDDLDKIMSDVRTDVKINTLTLSEDGDEKDDNVVIYMVMAYIMSFLIYMFVFIFGAMVMRSVIDEKSSRVVEVIVASVKSVDLMMGKIIGVALVALTQFAIWVGLTVAILGVSSSVLSSHLVEKAGGMEAVMAQAGIQTGNMDLATIIATTNDDPDSNDIADIIRQVSQIPWATTILCFVAYFLLGYLLYAAMFAAIGAAVDNEADTNQLQLPVTIPLMVGLFIMLHTFEHPSSALSVWASIIPFTSPMVMLARIPFGVVPAWQLALSIGLLVLTFIGVAYLSAKIYRMGILTYGKKSSFKDLYKWLKQSK